MFFPPGWYHFNKTVSLLEDPAPDYFGNHSLHGKGVVLRGSDSPRTVANAAGVKMPPDVSFTMVPQTKISGPAQGPAFRIGAADTGAGRLEIHGHVRMENLDIHGNHVALTAYNAANLRFVNCGFAAHHNASEWLRDTHRMATGLSSVSAFRLAAGSQVVLTTPLLSSRMHLLTISINAPFKVR